MKMNKRNKLCFKMAVMVFLLCMMTGGKVCRAEEITDLSGKKLTGYLETSKSQKTYRICAVKTGSITLRFSPKQGKNGVGWGYDLELYSDNGKKIIAYSRCRTETIRTFYVKKGNYYVVVKAAWSGAAPDADGGYEISALSKTENIASMKQTIIHYARKTRWVKWKKVWGADGYEIQIYPNKRLAAGSAKILTTSENYVKIPKRLFKGTYYVRIRAYRDCITGERIYGKYTRVKKIKSK